MKRIFLITLLLAILSFTGMSVCASNEGGYKNAGELYKAWMDEGHVPDCVTGIWSADGGSENLVIGILQNEAGEVEKNEILYLIEDDSSVQFVFQERSRNYLYAIMNDIDTYFCKDLGLLAAGVSEYQNCVEIQIRDTRMEDPDTVAMVKELTEKYGDAVSFSYTDAIIVPVGTETGSVTVNASLQTITGPEHPFHFWNFAVVGILLTVVLMLYAKKRQLMTHSGNISFRQHRISRKRVEALVRETVIAPSETLDQTVMASIEKVSRDH